MSTGARLTLSVPVAGSVITERGRCPEHLPVGLFATVMGVAGLAVAWQRAAAGLNAPRPIGDALAWSAAVVFVLVAAAYAAKVIRFPAAARAELENPMTLAFAATTTVSLLLVATALAGPAPGLSAPLWWAGAAGQLAMTLHVLRTWLGGPGVKLTAVHPGWFIPVVGNLVAPLAGVKHAPIGLSWFFFGVGIVYWLTLAPMVLHRMVTEPLPPQLKPTQAILIAPPAVAGLAWVSLGHGWADPVSRVLLAVAILHGLLVAGQARELARPVFAVGVWAYTFPLAALASALLAAQDGRSWIARLTAAIVLAVVSTVVLGVAVRTIVAVLRHEICRPAGPATQATA